MWNIPDSSWGEIVAIVGLTVVIVTAIICNTKTRISQQKYDHRKDIAPERFSYKLQKEEQKIRLTAELFGSNGGSKRIEAEPDDYTSTGA